MTLWFFGKNLALSYQNNRKTSSINACGLMAKRTLVLDVLRLDVYYSHLVVVPMNGHGVEHSDRLVEIMRMSWYRRFGSTMMGMPC